MFPERGAHIEIVNVIFGGNLVTIGYVELPTDVRVRGQVAMQHQIQLSLSHPDYAEDAEKLHDRAVRMLRNAMEDFEASQPHEHSRDDDEDERGMGE